jgi:hypothetical protein
LPKSIACYSSHAKYAAVGNAVRLVLSHFDQDGNTQGHPPGTLTMEILTTLPLVSMGLTSAIREPASNGSWRFKIARAVVLGVIK